MDFFRRYSFRLEPVGSQCAQFFRIGHLNRYVWNWFLGYCEDAYLAARSAGGKPAGIYYREMSRVLTLLKAEQPGFYEAPADTLQQTLMDLDQARKNFFSKTAGRPRFRGRDRFSFRFPNPKQFQIDSDWIKLPKVGWLRFRKSQPIEGKLRSVTVSFENGHWWLSILVVQSVQSPVAPVGAPVGIDRGIAQSLTFSDGKVSHFPVTTVREERRARFLARAVSRKEKGSNRRRRALDRLSKLRRRVSARQVRACRRGTD